MAGGLLAAIPVVVAVLLFTTAPPVMAWGIPCDFLTGGGFIIHNAAHANFGVAGGCKNGSPTWGHLEYIDHGTGLNVHWTSITGYFPVGSTGADPKTGQPTGERLICGTARTNLYGDVNFVVDTRDMGEPGINDTFDIRLRTPPVIPGSAGADVYDTTTECWPHYLGSSVPCGPGTGGGGNIQLHKPNPSTTGDFGNSCPAY